MSIYCGSEYESDDADWWWTGSCGEFEPLDTKRGRKCCSCGVKIKPGEEAMPFKRWRTPSDRCNCIEESIYGDEVPMAPWFMCSKCGGLAMALPVLRRRIDCYRVHVDGQPWKARIGWSRILAGLRKSLPRLASL